MKDEKGTAPEMETRERISEGLYEEESTLCAIRWISLMLSALSLVISVTALIVR